ncbi:MAG: cytochrome ubiquinol oxidase subunit I [Thermodesulfobacteriota bacterium]
MGRKKTIFFICLALLFFCATASHAFGYEGGGAHGRRLAVWLLAQTHLWFAAFILAVPIFVLILEFTGHIKKDGRYDRVAYEFMRVSTTAYSLTAITGVVFAAALFLFYPALMGYMGKVFKPTYFVYILLFVLENVFLYAYYYGWERMTGRLKPLHLLLGLGLNVSGTSIMFIANAWTSFMMSPAGVNGSGEFTGNLWQAITNPFWMPLNVHRLIANVAFGGSIVAAYAAYRFLSAEGREEKAHYDWMGYTANFVSILSLLPLPFAGYWLTAEIYAYSQQMGITLMGGAFGWMFVVQAVLIGALFLSANYYLWCGLSRRRGGERYVPYIKYIAFFIGGAFLVWFTPHTPAMTPSELSAIGSQYHPILGPLGIMPAKNIAVNAIILFTFLSFLLYWRSGSVITASWAWYGKLAQAAVFAAALVNIMFLGVYYGYFTNTVYKVASSVPQVVMSLVAIGVCAIIEFLMHRGAEEEAVQWGNVPERSQYALVLLAVSFTWLMGLMGFIRSAIREDWHIYAVLKDTSPDAFTPTIAYATRTVSIGTIVFMGLIVFIFWLNRPQGKS